ncbi:MAG: ABC transporter permease [Ruminococcus sp.]|nr:ABC transporter permease [Ruminococcus sp.]
MEMTNKIKFKHQTFCERLKSMLKVDFRRMFTSSLFYIMAGVCLVVPILIVVMTTMMDGTVSVDPNTGAETVIEAFDNVWQTIGSVSGEGSAMSMDLTGMCNINLVYFFAAVFICIFISDDFRSGYAKNLFTVRANKGDYVASKTIVGFIGGAFMLIAFFLGSMLGGAISGLPFDTPAGTSGIVMCMISKIFLLAVFVSIYVLASVIGKQKLWQSLVGSLMIGMLFFMMIPMLIPLDAGMMNVLLSLVGGALFAFGLGSASNHILKKTSLV